ncbi:SAG-related sequence [Besnoitia besnoiti]|uniref:SAG-related sequence n=1 Tax=Besnoitia besnoiti TaxID=94643 RepID=A0A2A9MKL9_BESBE|nr:SAG-related sequence [Besnoitia besnoiti]PFH37764.1 SAG-related sequence [Besnoitia besnoiti]
MADSRLTLRHGGRSRPPVSVAWKIVAVYASGVLLFTPHQADGHRLQQVVANGNLGREQHSPGAAASSTCELEKPGGSGNGEPSIPVLTLSADTPTATLLCSGGDNTVVPSDDTKVCSAQTSTISTCAKGDDGTQVLLKQLLESTDSIKSTITPTKEPVGKHWTLSLKEFPLIDQAFVVGCQRNNQDTNSKCKVRVDVKARPSTVEDGNIVTCSYGKDSNLTPLQAELTKENNELALACGNHGTITPTTFTTHLCQDDTLKKCEKRYTEVLPLYSESWWTNTSKDGDPVKFKVPKEGFPTADQKFYIGCLPKKAEEGHSPSRDVPGKDAATTTPCKVLVTVKAASSPSAASSALLAAVFAAGVAVFPGLSVGSA